MAKKQSVLEWIEERKAKFPPLPTEAERRMKMVENFNKEHSQHEDVQHRGRACFGPIKKSYHQK